MFTFEAKLALNNGNIDLKTRPEKKITHKRSGTSNYKMIRAVFLGLDGQSEKGRGTKEGLNDEEQAEFGGCLLTTTKRPSTETGRRVSSTNWGGQEGGKWVVSLLRSTQTKQNSPRRQSRPGNARVWRCWGQQCTSGAAGSRWGTAPPSGCTANSALPPPPLPQQLPEGLRGSAYPSVNQHCCSGPSLPLWASRSPEGSAQQHCPGEKSHRKMLKNPPVK